MAELSPRMPNTNAEATWSQESTQEERDYVARQTRVLLTQRRAEVERFIAWGRLVFAFVFLVRGFAIHMQASWKIIAFGLPIAVSLFALRRSRNARFSERDLVVIVVGDAIIGAIALGGNIFENHIAYTYLGLFRMPDVAVVILLVTLAAFRFSEVGVLASAIANALVSLGLAWVDTRVHGSTLGYDARELSTHLIVLTATAALGIFSSVRMRNMLTDQALTLLREERVRRNLDEVLRDSHDIRASLQAALIDTELLHRGTGDEDERRRQATSVHENLENVAAHLVRMRRFSSTEAEQASRSDVAVVDDAIEDSVRATRAAFSKTTIHFVRRGNLRVRVVGGARGLRRIADNLLRNACEGSNGRHASTVRVFAEEADGVVRLTFEDDGPGFDAAARDAVRAGRAFTTKPSGGFGLDFVRRTIHESEGELSIDAGDEGGARVFVRLPSL